MGEIIERKATQIDAMPINKLIAMTVMMAIQKYTKYTQNYCNLNELKMKDMAIR